MRRFLTSILAVAMSASLLAGCGGNSTSSGTAAAGGAQSGGTAAASGDSSASSGTTELVFWHNRGGSAGEVLQTIVDDFNANAGAELGIHITAVYQSDSVSAFKTLVQAKDTSNYPDLIQIFAGDVEYMSTVEAVVPVGDLMAKDDSFDADILESLLTTYTYNGTLYSMPFHASTMGFFWNKTAFAEAGLDPETPPATIDDMAKMAEKLLKVESNGTVSQYAITLAVSNVYLNHWISGQGEYSFIGDNEAGRAGRMTKVTFDTDGTMAKFLTEWKKVLDTGAVQYIESGNQARDEFCSGLSAMLCSSNSALGSVTTMSKEMGFDFGVAPLPKVSESDSGSVAPGGTSVYILNKGDEAKIQAAWDFIKFWDAPEQQYAFCSVTGTVPVNEQTFDYEPMKEYVEENPYFVVFYDALKNSNPKVQEHLAPTQQEFTTIFQEVGAKFSAGEISVDEAVEEMASRCNAALDEYNEANPLN